MKQWRSNSLRNRSYAHRIWGGTTLRTAMITQSLLLRTKYFRLQPLLNTRIFMKCCNVLPLKNICDIYNYNIGRISICPIIMFYYVVFLDHVDLFVLWLLFWLLIIIMSNKKTDTTILWNSIALTSIVVTELANTMKYGDGVLYNFVFNEFPFKTVSGDVTAFHRVWLYILRGAVLHSYSTILSIQI